MRSQGQTVLAVLALVVAACDRPRGEERDGPFVLARYQVLQLQPTEVATAARAGNAIPLTLGGTRFVLRLRPRNLVAPGCTVVELAEPPVTTPCATDLGTYAGADTSVSKWTQARLSITPDGVLGMVRTADVTWIIEPVRDSTAKLPDGVVRHIAYRTSDVIGRRWFEGARDSARLRDKPAHDGWGSPEAMRAGDDARENRCDPEDRPCHPPQGDTRVNGAPTPLPTLGIAFAADREYITGRASPTVLEREAATLNMVDGMYRGEALATFQIAAVITDPTNRFFSSSKADDLLNAVLPAYAAANIDVSVVANRVAHGISTAFLTSGKPPDGIILGMASQPGIRGMEFHNFSYALDAGTAAAIAAQNWMVMAHELGHIYNGQHEQADWFCRFWWLWCWNSARTIMWPSYSFRTSPEFSHGLLDGAHNNWGQISTHLRVRGP